MNNISQSALINESLWDKNDSKMTDRGFTITELFKPINVKLDIASFLRAQLSEEEVKKIQTIASVHIHANRAIQKVKSSNKLRMRFH